MDDPNQPSGGSDSEDGSGYKSEYKGGGEVDMLGEAHEP